MQPKTMRAFALDKPTKADAITLTDRPVPKVAPGRALIRVRAFGLNHAEQILRREEISAPYIQKPVIPGIECAGEIVDASDTRFKTGQKIIALMGGMGRSFDGSHAEYALLPERIIFDADGTDFTWEELGAMPETYFTAWGSLVESLHLQAGDKLLIRGATCALGYAALSLAKAMGATVVATTHRENKRALLAAADEIIIDDGCLKDKVTGITKALELVGPKTLKDTLASITPDPCACVCNTGVLGGVFALDDFDPIKDIPNGVYLTGFFSNYPSQPVIDEIFAFMKTHALRPHIGKVYAFDELRQACIDQDSGRTNGKIVVKVV